MKRGLFTSIIYGFVYGFIVVIIAMGVSPQAASAAEPVTYRLRWQYKGVPFKFKLYEAPPSVFKQVSETGTVEGLNKLQILRPLEERNLQVSEGESIFMYLVAENPTDKEVTFAVAPHETKPIQASLGFKFTCLCNGHIYRLPPKAIWYRIISLKALAGQSVSKVDLTHLVFTAKPR